MAGSTRNRTASKNRKSNSKAKLTKSTGRSSAKNNSGSDFLRSEIIVLAVFAVTVILFLSNFGLCGSIGGFLRGLMLGAFGKVGYVAPIVILIGIIFRMANPGNLSASLKIAAAVLDFIVLCGFFDLLFKKTSGGGKVGAFITGILGNFIGTIGTLLVLMILFIIGIVCITEKSIVKFVGSNSNKAYNYAREDISRRKEVYDEQRAERKAEKARIREEQRHGSGVNFGATDLAGPLIDKDEKKTSAGFRLPKAEVYAGKKTSEIKYDEITPEKTVAPERTEASENLVTSDFPAFTAVSQASSDKIAAEEMVKAAEPVKTVDPAVEIMNKHKEEVSKRERKNEYGANNQEIDNILKSVYVTKNTHRTLEEQLRDETYEEPVNSRPFYTAPAAAQSTYTAPAAQSTYTAPTAAQRTYTAPTPVQSTNTAPASVRTEAPVISEPLYESQDDFLDADEIDLSGKPAEQVYDEPEPSYNDSMSAYDDAEPVQENNMDSYDEPPVKTSFTPIQAADSEPVKVAGQSMQAVVSSGVAVKPPAPVYKFPPTSLLKKAPFVPGVNSTDECERTMRKLEETLSDFGVGVHVTNFSRGPAVTRYELTPEHGVKVSRILSLQDDIKLSLAAADIRIEAPIPGKSAIGIEVPNKDNNAVYFRELLESKEFESTDSRLSFAVGKDIAGQTIVSDIAKMPHLLIAGATGSGKSVCINTLIMSILYKARPDEVGLIMIDPKVVELSVYNGIPHLLLPVVTDPKKAAGALSWAVAEMTNRYNLFSRYGCRNIKGYNEKVDSLGDIPDKPEKMKQIVIIVDELADLMMVAPGEVEDSICRIAQLARAAGIHLVIATQRPSVNVITGVIKANIPSRVAFAVSSAIDSRTIIDMGGAEKLLGKGDMLFYPQGYQKPQRVQGAFISDNEVAAVVDFIKESCGESFASEGIGSQISFTASADAAGGGSDQDSLFADAGKAIIEKDKASIGMLQRMFKIGFNRAARIMDQLADAGVVGPEEGTKPRKILMSAEEFENYLEQN